MRSLRRSAATSAATLAAGIALAGPGNAVAADCGKVGQAPRQATSHQLRTSVLCLVNEARRRHGIAALEFNLPLRKSATAHSKTMVRSGTLSHYGPRGSTLTSRVLNSGYLARVSNFRLAENIAAGRGRARGSPAAIVEAWMRSPGHRRNILDRSMRDFGVGIARGDAVGGGWRSNAVTYTLDLGARHG